MMDGIKKRIMGMVARAVVDSVADSSGLQKIKTEIRSELERFQSYGLTSNPLPGAEMIVLSLGGESGHQIVIAIDDRRYRLTGLQSGEVALYTDEGDYVRLGRNGVMTLNAGSTLKLGGESASDPVMRKSDFDSFLTKYNAHIHPVPGVTTGPGSTSSSPTVSTHVATASTKVKSQ